MTGEEAYQALLALPYGSRIPGTEWCVLGVGLFTTWVCLPSAFTRGSKIFRAEVQTVPTEEMVLVISIQPQGET